MPGVVGDPVVEFLEEGFGWRFWSGVGRVGFVV